MANCCCSAFLFLLLFSGVCLAFTKYTDNPAMSNHSNQSAVPCQHLKTKVNDSGVFNTTCQLVLANCTNVPVLANYLAFVTCDLVNLQWLAYIILVLWLILLMSLLATTADYFFVPPLNLLANKLKLSPAVAGITLLAIGNGAPDVFTAYSALTKADDFALELSALLGASIFILTVVLGSVILVSDVSRNTIKATDFYRDIGAYIVVVATVVGVCYDKKIYLYESVLFLVIYILYIGIVVSLSYYQKRTPLPSEKSLLIDDSIRTDHSELNTVNLSTEEDEDSLALSGLSWPSEKGWALKFQFIVEYPFSVLRWLTVPSCDTIWDTRRWIFAILCPVPAGFLLLIAAKSWDGFLVNISSHFPVYALIVVIGTATSVLLFSYCIALRNTSQTLMPNAPVQFLFGFLAFITSIAWMNILANEVVAVLQSFGILFNISLAVLGVTVLAIGNSIGDWVADTAVARAGTPAMGVSSCFGSPLLNDVLGLGISLTANTAKNYPRPYAFEKSSDSFQTVVFCWIVLGFVLLASLIVFPLFKFTPPKIFSLTLFVIYILFMVLNVLDVTKLVKMNFHY
eukprot:m.49534 g.49534  ORF g.49534 m.49534 type:complete len:570 (+) comp34008_c0_seq1:16-1725(+)